MFVVVQFDSLLDRPLAFAQKTWIDLLVVCVVLNIALGAGGRQGIARIVFADDGNDRIAGVHIGGT